MQVKIPASSDMRLAKLLHVVNAQSRGFETA
jgi:hypothetical protein